MKKQLGLIGAIGFGVVALFFGVAAAQTPPTEEKAPRERAHKMRGDHGPGPGRGMKHHMGPGIHGEFTVRDGQGGFKTVASQFGEVTAVTPESITVKSEDGFTRTYAVTEATRVGADGRDGIADIATGDEVGVRADVSGDTATATHIHERRPKPAE